MGNQAGDVKDHAVGIAVLAGFTVEEGLYAKVLWVLDVSFNPWAEGLVAGLGFGTEPLFVCVLVGAVADVVATGVSEDIVEGVFLANTMATAPNYGNEFGFIVDGVVGLGEGHGSIRAGNGGGGAQEGDGCVRVGAGWVDAFEFINVGGIVQADGVHMRWVHRCQQLAIRKRDGGVCEIDVWAKDVAINEGGGLVVIDAGVVDLLVEFNASEFHG